MSRLSRTAGASGAASRRRPGRSAQAGPALAAALAAWMDLVARGIVALYFRRLSVLHRERFPRRGPVLAVANHPATWTDVAVLDVTLGRKLHFLAHDRLYKPWPRAWVLALHGSVPVAHAESAEATPAVNEQAFGRCWELFDRGQVVAIFPEGVSSGDRDVQPLKTGTARIVLGYLARRGVTLPLVPIGIHYTDRTRPRSDVEIVVGTPVELAPHTARWEREPDQAVRGLTDLLQRQLEGLILDVPEELDPDLVALLQDLWKAPPRDAGLDRALGRRIVEAMQVLRARDRAGYETIGRWARKYGRVQRATGLPHHVLIHGRSSKPALALRLLLGAVPAALGALVHLAPWALVESIARSAAPEAPRISFARIVAGLALFPAAYAGLGWYLLARGLPAVGLALVSPLLIGLGLLARAYRLWLLELASLLRLQVIRRRHPGLVERARATRTALLDRLGLRPASLERP